MTPAKLILTLALTVWALAVGIGLGWLTNYSLRPGHAAQAPLLITSDLTKYREKNRPTFLLFAHPRCPCTRASIAELARLVAQNQGRANFRVLFFQPLTQPREWAHSSLWEQAAQIPEVNVASISELDLQRFGVFTSGQTLLYDATGQMVFSGGITSARGHEGDNMGRTIVSEFLHGKMPPVAQTPVFGCLISDAE